MPTITPSVSLKLKPAVMRVGRRLLRVERGVLVVPERRLGGRTGSMQLPVVRFPAVQAPRRSFGWAGGRG